MWSRIKKKGIIYLYILSIILSIGILLYIPVKCSIDLVDRIQNPPSEIYAENQTLDKWKSFCIDGESEDGCELEGYRLKTKSKLGPINQVPIPVISVIEVDEYYEELSITLRDWKTGEIIQPYPQQEHKWYEFYKKYDSFETIGTLFDENGDDIISYEVTLLRNKIIITKESCDSRGYEENGNKVKGGCFLLEDYEKNRNVWYSLDIILKDNRKVLINL
jgi:hypothetical protein